MQITPNAQDSLAMRQLVANAYRDARAVLSPAEMAECRVEAAAMTADQVDAMLAELRRDLCMSH